MKEVHKHIIQELTVLLEKNPSYSFYRALDIARSGVKRGPYYNDGDIARCLQLYNKRRKEDANHYTNPTHSKPQPGSLPQVDG